MKKNWVVGLGLVFAAALVYWFEQQPHTASAEPILEAFHAQQSDVWVQTQGTVQRVLSDDNEGSRHQRFILRLSSGHTVLIAHNIDLADRVPLSQGDTVMLRGEYEWNEKGGVVHWTHHDPRRRIDGGYIEHAGKRYR